MKKNGFTRILLVLLTGISLFCLLPCAALAADTDALYEESGIENAFDVLDEQTLSLLESLGLDISDPASLLDITPARVVSAALSLFTGGLTEPMQKCAIIMGAVLLFALLDSAAPSVGKSSDTGGMLLMLMLSLLVIAPVSDCVSNVLSAIRVLSGFTRMLIPILASFVAASGKPLLSASFSAASLGAAEAVSWAVDTFFVPLVGAYAAICVVAAVNPVFNLQNIALFFRRIFTVVLGVISSLFAGVLSIKSAATASVDSLTFKGVKFLVGGLVPVVGGALSEGLTSVTAALNAVNQTIGALGILVMVLITLPSVLQVLIWWAALYICSMAATLTGQTQVAFYLSGVSNVIVMLNILLLFDAFVFIAAVGIVMRFAGG